MSGRDRRALLALSRARARSSHVAAFADKLTSAARKARKSTTTRRAQRQWMIQAEKYTRQRAQLEGELRIAAARIAATATDVGKPDDADNVDLPLDLAEAIAAATINAPPLPLDRIQYAQALIARGASLTEAQAVRVRQALDDAQAAIDANLVMLEPIIERLEASIAGNNDSQRPFPAVSRAYLCTTVVGSLPLELRDMLEPRHDGAPDEHGVRADATSELAALASSYAYREARLGQRFADVLALWPRAGWSLRDHAVFEKEYDEAPRSNPHWRRDLFERLHLLLPHQSHNACVIHETFVRRAKVFHSLHATLLAGLASDVEELAAAALRSETEAQAAAAAAQAAADDLAAFDRLRRVWHAELAKWREIANERAAAEAAEQAAADQAAAQAAAEQVARENARRAKEAERLARYAADKAAAARDAARAEERAAAAAKAAKAAARRSNAPRVAYRAAEFKRKVASRKAAAAAKAAADAARDERLHALASEVAPHVAPDPKRLIQPTAAWQAHKDAQTQKPLFKAPAGYTNVQVFQDERARIGYALASAGLQTSDYARFVLQSAAPATIPRPDSFSTFERAA
ncbi:uncharacterized protein AMSG_02349 [Thecamonas trahens ATCC 50062]|uniref:Uncharacterized protein n=1 Tax=Thecamonas trahens ATCC 50062 TaxID=461836 RepID=A0A0L0DVN2_THETB|nr:hypothetical protein AMSG_02349 [Thecamonas trahens ATCC 50062]KNC56379.1 hypothetical protein AMSG_02349 [Thecamonas trahens ATCC 50062]|eukprot:XP_013760894.1 hypothetical protein AMSG_02349 [Thecamonas trahens ATCC 50062]